MINMKNYIIVIIFLIILTGCSPFDLLEPEFNFTNEPVLIIGDSIAHLGHWEKCFPNVVNKGISSTTTKQWIENKLINSITDKYEKIYVNLGINDLGRGKAAIENVINNYSHIIDYLKKHSDDINIFSVMDINVSIYTQYRNTNTNYLNLTDERIQALNAQLFLLAKEKNIHFVNIYPSMTRDNQMKAEYTYDGVHPNEEGYNKIFEIIKKLLEEK